MAMARTESYVIRDLLGSLYELVQSKLAPNKAVSNSPFMTERAVGRPWTAREDQLLANAVAVHGQVDNWKAVALSVPGRTNKACRKASYPPSPFQSADLTFSQYRPPSGGFIPYRRA